ncbi:MAG: hypothetical protein O3B85_06325 [Planctomycetota bacterium]|nr:hypothetical protein [Planctomycetota bacterium]
MTVPRSRTRRLLFLALTLCIAWGLAEVVALLGFLVLTGEGFSPSRLAAERAGLAASASTPADARQIANATNWSLHPYLGYVLDPEDATAQRGAGGLDVTEWGFFDEGAPFRERAPGDFVIAVLGGSVAAMFAEEGVPHLAKALRTQPGLEDRRLVFVRLANPGYRQPQHKFALDLAFAQGGQFDAVLVLDGLNELSQSLKRGAMEGVHPLFPSNWQFLAADTLAPAVQRAIGGATFVRGLRADVASWFGGLLPSWSPLANLGWKLVDRALAAQGVAYSEAASTSEQGGRAYATLGPGPRPTTDDEVIAYGAEVWAECARMIHATCAARGIPSFHFLQPNQYVPGSKPIGAAERAVAVHDDHPTRFAVERGYPVLQALGEALRADGVAFEDLTEIFADVAEPLYVDACCHLGARGNELLALEIARRVAPRLAGAEPVPTVRGLRASPVVLDAPFARGRVVVFGDTADGSTVDVTYSCRDYESSAPEVVRVDAYGALTALGAGAATVSARLGSLTVTVPVEVSLPEVASVDAGSMRGGAAPTLRGAVRDGVLEAWIDPAPAVGASGWLVVGHAPRQSRFCRETHFVDFATDQKIPYLATADGVRFDVPLASVPKGRSVFVQILAVERDQACGLRASNALVVTPR